MLNDAKLSDLFFNHEHPKYDLAYETYGDPDVLAPTQDEVEAAMRKDAYQFAYDYPEFGKDGDWYYNDFFRRL